MYTNRLFFYKDEIDAGCACGQDHNHNHDHDYDEFEEDMMIEIVDPETDEVYQFYLGDEFDYQDDLYYVLVTIDDDPVFVIARVVEQDGEIYIETLDDEENEEIYEVYDRILEDTFEDEE
ncbi:MAG: hypothetical protein GX328_07040 [Clostridiaceae bacterium]|nr:hypothetical protein [Clostridiaceae bacterium]